MEEHRFSLFGTYDASKDKDRFSAALNPKAKDSEMRALLTPYWYTASQIYQVNGLSQSPDEEIFFVVGTRASQMSPHPRPEKFSKIITFIAGGKRVIRLLHYNDNNIIMIFLRITVGNPFFVVEGREMEFDEILKKVLAVYKTRLLAKDQSALLDVAEICGKLYSPFYQTKSPEPVLTNSNITDLYQKYGTTVPENMNMKPDWLTVIHLPQLHVSDGIATIDMWAGRDDSRVIHSDFIRTVPLWRLTITFTEDDIAIKPRRIQKCYEDLIIKKIGYGNFIKNMNYKLFDNAFMFLARHKFKGNEVGYTPGDDKFRKFFQVQLRRRKNMTPESIRFLLNNCCVNSLDLSDIHYIMDHKCIEDVTNEISATGLPEFPPPKASSSTYKRCELCKECLKIPLEDTNNLNELYLNDIRLIESIDGLAVNTNITRLVTNRAIADLQFLDPFPNLETLSLYSSKYSIPTDVTPIERLTRLKHLDIHGTPIAKKLNFDHMSQLRSLNIVEAWSASETLNSEGLEHVARSLPNLESINLTGSGLTSLHALGDMQHLTRVELAKCQHGEALSALTNIKVLKLTDTYAKQQHFDAIGKLTQLEDFVLLPHTPSELKLEPSLMKLTNLKSLTTHQNSNTGVMLEALPSKIEHLKLSMKNFNPIVSTLTNLKSLVLSITDPASDLSQFYETIAKLTQLESLDLSPMTNDGFGKLTTLVNLKELNIREQKRFDSHGAVHFKHFTKLRRVSFHSTPIADLTLVYLTKLEQLEYLSLTRTCVSKEGLEFLENHRAYLEIVTDPYNFQD